MAITANRHLALILLAAAAAISYIVGFTVGFWVLIAAGAVFEIVFWIQFLFQLRRSSRD
jgi:general stress protein CsbA